LFSGLQEKAPAEASAPGEACHANRKGMSACDAVDGSSTGT